MTPHETVMAFMRAMKKESMTKVFKLRVVAQDNQVVLERLDRHRIPQGWFELPVTGVFDVNDSKITYWREDFDMATITDPMQKLMGGAQ